jgi:hypothetical protein
VYVCMLCVCDSYHSQGREGGGEECEIEGEVEAGEGEGELVVCFKLHLFCLYLSFRLLCQLCVYVCYVCVTANIHKEKSLRWWKRGSLPYLHLPLPSGPACDTLCKQRKKKLCVEISDEMQSW